MRDKFRYLDNQPLHIDAHDVRVGELLARQQINSPSIHNESGYKRTIGCT